MLCKPLHINNQQGLVSCIKIYPKEQAKQYLIIDVVSIIILIFIVLSSNSNLPVIAKIIVLITFLTAFYVALWYRDWRLHLATLTGLFSVAIIGIYEGSIMLFFGFTFADLIGRAQVKWHIASAMLAIALMFIVVLWVETGELFKIDDPIILPIMLIQLVFPVLIYYIEKAKNLKVELATVNTQLVKQHERQRIARDLHDTIGHTLTMIKLKTELTTKLVDKDPPRVKGELQDILATTRTALKQVRELVSDMNFVSLESELLHCEKLLLSADIAINISNNCPKILLSSVEETMLALCVREATTNILKHSQAKSCIVEIDYFDPIYTLNIIDDGIGLENQGLGNGLSSIQERMTILQGTATIDNFTNGGTIVSLKLPFQHYRKEPLK
ncbi:two-component system sensor histidine kinase DesK [Lysinibacillus parviboronicapiens]|uniref:histidine kinase n=1 Tax=Lysinibacillus parviboronicapiens TaxID=436516 RepID=A0ABV2PHK1_9BACI